MVGAKHKGEDWLEYGLNLWSHEELPLQGLDQDTCHVILLYTPIRKLTWDRNEVLRELGTTEDTFDQAHIFTSAQAGNVLQRALGELYQGHPEIPAAAKREENTAAAGPGPASRAATTDDTNSLQTPPENR